MKALIAGSVVACALGVAVGSNMKTGLHPDGPDLRGAADTLVQFAAPPAEAAETAPDIDQPSPTLYVRYGDRWVTEAERASEQADAQNQAAAQTQPQSPPQTQPTSDQANGGRPTDPPPPPLVLSLNEAPNP